MNTAKTPSNPSRQATDPEAVEWLEALEDVLEYEGIDRANFLLQQLSARMTETGARLPYTVTTPYRNTIPINREVFMPGDLFYLQGHSSPGICARCYLEGRICESQLDQFRREVGGGGSPPIRTRGSCQSTGSSPLYPWGLVCCRRTIRPT